MARNRTDAAAGIVALANRAAGALYRHDDEHARARLAELAEAVEAAAALVFDPEESRVSMAAETFRREVDAIERAGGRAPRDPDLSRGNPVP